MESYNFYIFRQVQHTESNQYTVPANSLEEAKQLLLDSFASNTDYDYFVEAESLLDEEEIGIVGAEDENGDSFLDELPSNPIL